MLRPALRAALLLSALALLLLPAPAPALEYAEPLLPEEAAPTILLQQAIRAPNSTEIERAINAGAQVTEESLWLAAIYADPEILKFLLKRNGVSPDATFSIGMEAGPGQEDSPNGASLRRRVLSLLSDGPPARLLERVSLLHLAAVSGNTDVARYLLESGVPVNEAMSSGGTAMTVAYCAWLRSWNPMLIAPEAFSLVKRDTNYPGFIYFLLDMGANADPMEDLIEAKRDAIERYVVSLTSAYHVRMRDGSERRLGDVLEQACTRTAWGLIDYQVFGRRSVNYCRMTVVFFGRLKATGESVRIPFVFLDDKFLFPGDPEESQQFTILKNGVPMPYAQLPGFWGGLGVDPACTRGGEGS